MVTVEYRCADGTRFPVEFATAEDAARVWHLEREHAKEPAPPLAAALGGMGDAGKERAYAEAGLRLPSNFRDGPSPFGFAYYSEEPMSAEDMAASVEGSRKLIERYGSGEAIWNEHCLPRAQAACAWLQQADGTVPLRRIAEEHAYAMHQTMVAMFVTGNDLRLLSAACDEALGEKAPLVAFELTQGYDNETVRADQALWEVARRAADAPGFRDALASADPKAAVEELRAGGREAEAVAALDLFLDRYGWRSEDWQLTTPTWSEQKPGFWAQLRRMAVPGVEAPAATLARAAARREAVVAEIDARLADDEEKRARFHRRVARVGSYVAIREERALWQLIAAGSARHAVLRRGADLVARDVVERDEDVFYLRPEEVETATGDLSSVVAERRAEHERWLGVLPPTVIGGESAVTPPATELPDDRVLRGRPGARGVATGPARVVTDLAHADDFEAGEVLVCVMTAPPWTPLFGVAAAVVTDTGDIGSHPAIAAREYGIPCVVGTTIATATITDGAVVTVDGDAGTVRVASAG